MKKKHEALYDVVVIGGGVVGLASGLYCGRLKLKAVVLSVDLGGTIINTHIVENYPGFKAISGQGLADKILEHAKQYPIEVVEQRARKITKCKHRCFIVYTAKRHFHTKTIIFATGSDWRKLNVKGEEEYKNKGVHYCVLCDGQLYKNKITVIAGGGDSAAKEALLLAKYARKVYIIARSKLKPEPINMDRIKKEKKIEVIEDMQVKEIKGDGFVNSVILSKQYKNSSILKAEGVFVDVGHVPKSELAVKIGIKINKSKEIIINKESKTNIKGVYAAGDVADTKFKQAITGIGEAVKAVYSIYEYINNERIMCSCVKEY